MFKFKDIKLHKYLIDKGYIKDMTTGGTISSPPKGCKLIPLIFRGKLIFEYTIDEFIEIEDLLPVVQ